MTSRLSSLLVRDGVVVVRRMEKAFQRQVLFGGALDTILLELNDLNEQRLVHYLSLATGLPPATARELENLDPRAAERCGRELAERFQVVPLSFEGDALRVLTRDPVDLGALEDLASELGAPVQPLVAPEFRFELAFDRVFGRTSDARFTRLAEASRLSAIPPQARAPAVVVGADAVEAAAAQAGSAVASGEALPRQAPAVVEPPPAEAGLADGGIVEAVTVDAPAFVEAPAVAAAQGGAVDAGGPVDVSEGAGAEAASPSRGPMRQTRAMTTEAVRERLEETGRLATDAYRRIAGHDTDPGAARAADSSPEPAVIAEPAAAGEVVIEYDTPDSGALTETRPAARPAEDVSAAGAVAGAVEHAAAPTAPLRADDSAPTVQPFRRMTEFDPAPLDANEARKLLARADNRDTVFEVLLRAVRARTWYVALLTVQGGAAIGRVAIAGGDFDQSHIGQVLIPLDAPSAFRTAVNTASPYIGPVATGDVDIDAMIRRMGGVVPPSALLLPIVLRNRVVALVVGHRGADMLRITELSELLPLTAAASEALGRIIMRGKSQSKPPARGRPDSADPQSAPVSPAVDESAATRRIAVVPPAGAAVAVAADVEALMVALQGGNDEARGRAMREALARPADVLPWLRVHFPGKLDVDRAGLGSRHLPAAQHGPVLELVVRAGAAASDLVAGKMRDGDARARYYAALCAAEMKLASLLSPLVERLFDHDQPTRDVAIDALSGYPASELEAALDPARRALHGDEFARVEAAANALSALGDARAIPDLLDLHARGGGALLIATTALVALTKQDFGHHNRKWRQWWDKHRRQSRIEWLLDGLGHKETHIRRSAAEDLRKATGEYFGYHHDLPRREREQARQRWLDWWQQTGRRRFLPLEEHEPSRTSTSDLHPRRS